ncbi:hypothetical protein GII36_05800 [Candidatus Mycosynbacter amalyticus]|uniref:Polysaccharide pyruvyl transferase domain-containing protein n=1 Tax=Candidatus Mycosynbacter amalyticus TaxID=2665156 RepID=A0A857MP11_9BACT|nr:polysaccharide pyruvyl transferase family protein [Candidatus Mycosynbacter amalyticus]QHN43332.1 hypothetical protein GII36_05800 [Candidatus Mycosynbacter amalyticus]
MRYISELLTRVGRRLDRRHYSHADGAILTLTGYFNYGNVIQRYALQQFLVQHGHKFVSYVDTHSAPHDHYRITRRSRLKTPARAIKRFLRSQRPYWYVPSLYDIHPESHRIGHIIEFVNDNIWIKPFDPKDTFGHYVVGSDQVWRNWWNNSETLGYYFLDFLEGREVNRVAYAASFGMEQIGDAMTPDDIEYVRPHIQLFDSLSVREETGVDIVFDTWGRDDVVNTVDPTLLLSRNDYSTLIDKSAASDEQVQPVFTYIIDQTTKEKAFISRMKRYYGVAKATEIRTHGGAENDTLPPMELWLKGFRDSDLVVTNSYHGLLFSVINNTNFIVVGRTHGGLSRLHSFLSEYGLESRFVDETALDAFDPSSLDTIDWTHINSQLDKRRTQSGDWLLQSLN